MTPVTPRFAILAADFNTDVVHPMIASATATIQELEAKLVRTLHVPGCYELPLVAETLLRRGDVEALIALGYIERGETLHGEVMGHVVHAKLVDLSLQYRKPIGLGIIGPGATLEQAQTRKVAYGRSAVMAAMQSLKLLAEIHKA